MAVPAVVDSLDKIPEKDREHYAEKDGKFVLQGEGIKTSKDVETLQEALRKERGDHGKAKEELKKFTPHGDATEILAKLDRVAELEEIVNAGIDPTKIDPLVESRVKIKVAPLERELNLVKTQLQQKDELLGSFKTKEKTRAIHDAIRAVAAGSNILPTAIEDALAMGERIFDVTEQGEVVTKENCGFVPNVDPKVWLTEVKDKRPHWWPASVGGGSKSGSGGGSGNNPFSFEHWNLTEQGKLVNADRGKAEQMAKAAGTKVGGAKPAPKK